MGKQMMRIMQSPRQGSCNGGAAIGTISCEQLLGLGVLGAIGNLFLGELTDRSRESLGVAQGEGPTGRHVCATQAVWGGQGEVSRVEWRGTGHNFRRGMKEKAP